ncbi:MAG TPA: hypothetical protein VFG19_17180 [Geobacteraceae bacterium]|nr:hypothetical protein [Geobacteraceae bacterium]
MPSLITRFRNELLNTELDVKSCDINQEHDGSITVTASTKPVHVVVAIFCTLPCLYFLGFVIRNPGIVYLTVALAFCPVLAMVALLVGCATPCKSIDRNRRLATRSLRFFSHVTRVTEPLASQGTITLTWEWRMFNSGGYSLYTIKVCPGTGLVFSTTNDYKTARAFAERLAALLSFLLEDSVPQRNRF